MDTDYYIKETLKDYKGNEYSNKLLKKYARITNFSHNEYIDKVKEIKKTLKRNDLKEWKEKNYFEFASNIRQIRKAVFVFSKLSDEGIDIEHIVDDILYYFNIWNRHFLEDIENGSLINKINISNKINNF
jgi:hypothetical protein